MSLERLEELATEYEKASNENKLIENGWLDDWITNYATTKLFINALRVVHTRAILFFEINVGSDRIVPTVSDFKFSLCVNDDSFI